MPTDRPFQPFFSESFNIPEHQPGSVQETLAVQTAAIVATKDSGETPTKEQLAELEEALNKLDKTSRS